MKAARFTIRMLDQGFIVTEEVEGLNRFGNLDWLKEREAGCETEAAVEEVLDKWDWQAAIGVPRPFPRDLQPSSVELVDSQQVDL